MPDVTHLPAALTGPSANNAQRNQGARAAQNNAGPKEANGKQADGAPKEKSFSAVLEEQCAPADAAITEEASKDETLLTAEAAGQPPLPTEAPVLSIDALIAQRLAALRPDAAAAAGAAANAADGKSGVAGVGRDAKAGTDAGLESGDAAGDHARSTLSGLGDRDARRPAAAGVTGADAAKAATGVRGKEGAIDAAPEHGSDFSALIGRLRQEGSAANPAATQAADNPISTLSMLMPANQITETAPAAAARPTTLIEAPVGSPLFADEAAQRITWLAKNNIEHAEIRVTPANMGPIQVSIDINQNEASINFVVAQTDTRVALEDSLHRLEEMLADSGIALAQANVGQQDPGQSQSGRESGGASGSGRSSRGEGQGSGEGISGPAMQAAAPRQGGSLRGLVDTFA